MPRALWEHVEGLMAGVRVADALDILVVSGITYGTFRWFRQSRSRLVMSGLATLVGLYFAAGLLQMHLTLALFQAGITVAAVTLVVIFQDEIKRGFERLGFASRLKAMSPSRESDTLADTVVAAVASFARSKTGALVVLRGREPLERHMTGGVRLNGQLSEPLLHSIFDTNSMGHDGALIVQDGLVTHFGVHLPLSVEIKGGERFGTRHTAALGLSERCDALIVVVSEERGTISVARNGTLSQVASSTELLQLVRKFYQQVAPDLKAGWARRWVSHNLGLKLASVAIALALWLVSLDYRRETAVRTISVPVVFSDIPKGWVVTNVNPPEVRVSLSGPERKLGALDETLTVSLSPPELKPGLLRAKVTSQGLVLPVGVQVGDIEPSSVQFSAERTVTATVVVHPDTKGHVAHGHALVSISVAPQEVRLVLPKSQSTSVRRVATESIDLEPISTSILLKVPLVLPTGATLAPGEPDVASVRIEVAEVRR